MTGRKRPPTMSRKAWSAQKKARARVHGVVLERAPSGRADFGAPSMRALERQWRVAQRNTERVNQSYIEQPGAYLRDGIYAHTREAWERYGDRRLTFEEARQRGMI